MIRSALIFFFFFQAEDGIRDLTVTGVQTCALPISGRAIAVAVTRSRDPGHHRYVARIPAPPEGEGLNRQREDAMEIILREDVQHLGAAGDVVKVKDGYARNYLLPKGLAYPATEANKKKI